MARQFDTLKLLFFDIIALNIPLLIIYLIRFKSGLMTNPALLTLTDIELVMIALSPPWLIILLFAGLYKRKTVVSRMDELLGIFKAGSIAAVVLFIITYESSNPHSNRMILFIYWLLTISFLGFERIAFRTWKKRQLTRGVGLKNAVIVGSGSKAISLAEKIRDYPALGLKITGLMIKEVKPVQPPEDIKILGITEHADKILKENDIEEVIIALEDSSRSEIMKVIELCNGIPVDIHVASDLYDIASGSARTDQIFGIPMVEIKQQNRTVFQIFLKRAFDLSFASVLFIFGLPLWVLCGILIKIDSSGPVFYRQTRVGRGGRIFEIFKFRTMTEDAEKKGPAFSSDSDPRVTRVGRILRDIHIDEFPQIINVLEGDMSFVGPRPERPYFMKEFVQQLPLYSRRLKVRPGITGWAQVKQSYEKSVSELNVKLAHDLFYIENFSFIFDLKIILLTLSNIFRGRISGQPVKNNKK